MAFIIKDRVKEGTTSTGTGAITLGGAAATFDPFNSYMSNGDTTYYAIVHTSSGVDEWEVGIGTWNTGNTLTRTTVLAGSNGTSAENFSAGTKDIFMTYPASKALFMDSAGDVAFSGDIDVAGSAEIETHIDLKTTTSNKPSHSEGRIFYDAAFGALAVYNDEADITLQVGQEEYIRVKNDTGATITNGTPVYLTGEDASTPTIAKAVADGTYAQSQAVGIATHDIEANSIGYITVRGLIADVDTSHLTVGEKVHVDVGGGTTTNAPSYPYFATDVGICLISSASGGCIYVYVETHAFESIRVTENAHFDSNVTIDGDLTVLGTQTIANSENISLSGAFNYFNSGDTIGDANTSFTGTGLDDATLTGHYEGTTTNKTFKVKITTAGTPDKFRWSTDNFTTQSAEINIDGTDQTLEDGISVQFNATTGHTVGDIWSGSASPVNVDSGIASNRNTGGSGVGYTHMGLYYDVSTNKWTFFDEYDPEPEGTIDTTDSSFSYATVKAGTFEGDLTGNVTGSVTGNVSGNVTGSLTGNVTGNVTGDVTGNADTATTLETARTISLTGDVTGSVSFDGSANASITAVVQDDSHSHVISNVDGLQAALDGKAATSTTITAGNGLTGGGNLTANRTLNVGAGSGISVTADAVAHADTSTQASVNNSGNTFIQDVTLDGFGHVTGLTSGSVSVGDATITIAAGGGLTGGAAFTTNQSANETITVSHADTSSQASVNNSNGTVIQDITLDGYGHITGINSVNLDGRYYTETEADSRFVNVTGDTMTGNLLVSIPDNGGAPATTAKLDLWGYEGRGAGISIRDSANSASGASNREWFIGSGYSQNGFNIGYSSTATQTSYAAQNKFSLSTSGNAVFAGTAHVNNNQKVFADNYHPNADKWTTARSHTVTLTGDVTGTATQSVDGTGNRTWSISTTVGNDSHEHTRLQERSTITYGAGQLQWTDLSGSGGTGLNGASPTNPTSDWYHHILMNHANSGGYYVDLAACFHHDGLYMRRLTNGSLGSWNRFFADNYHPNADKWTTARTLSLSGDASGSVSWDGSANATLSVTVANDSHTHSWNNITGKDATLLYQGGDITSHNWNDFINGTEASWNNVFNHSGSNRPSGSYTYGTALSFADSGRNAFQLYAPENASSGNGLWYRTTWNLASRPWVKIWDSGNDGSGSGLDADLLDGVQGSQFLRSDAADTWTGTLSWGGAGGGTAFQLNNGDILGVNKLHINDVGEGIHFGGHNAYPHLFAPDTIRVRNQTTHGYIEFGPLNTSHAHIQTDRSNFYFNKEIQVDGGSIRSHNEDLTVSRAGSGTARLRITNGITHSDQTFQVNGKLEFPQNPVGTTYGSGVSGSAPNMIYQRVGDNDGWRLYGEAPASNDVKVVFEVVDDIETGDTWVFRNKRTYSPYNATEPFKIQGNGNCIATGTVTATSFSGSGANLTGIVASAKNDIFWENGQNVTSNYTITNGKNAMSAGPITINSGVTVTVGSGETWTVV